MKNRKILFDKKILVKSQAKEEDVHVRRGERAAPHPGRPPPQGALADRPPPPASDAVLRDAQMAAPPCLPPRADGTSSGRPSATAPTITTPRLPSSQPSQGFLCPAARRLVASLGGAVTCLVGNSPSGQIRWPCAGCPPSASPTPQSSTQLHAPECEDTASVLGQQGTVTT